MINSGQECKISKHPITHALFFTVSVNTEHRSMNGGTPEPWLLSFLMLAIHFGGYIGRTHMPKASSSKFLISIFVDFVFHQNSFRILVAPRMASSQPHQTQAPSCRVACQ